jgi:predicted DNA-binding transcriptional regulator YafY
MTAMNIQKANPSKRNRPANSAQTQARRRGNGRRVPAPEPPHPVILRGRRWHPTQSLVELPGGGCHLRLRLGCLEEIEQHVLSWGTHANVIAPRELRRRLWRTAEELVRRYQEDGRRAEDPIVDPRVAAAESTAPLPEVLE